MIRDVPREEIEQALARFDQEDRHGDEWRSWERNRAHKFAIEHSGRRYPVKRIIEIATGTPVAMFSGGEEANGYAQQRGFTVVELDPPEPGSASIRGSIEAILSSYERETASSPFSKVNVIWRAFDGFAAALRAIPAIGANSALLVEASAGKGNWANVPWVAIMDRRETTTVQEGVYVVYLFREDMSGVYLTLNQGVTQTVRELGRSKARGALEERAKEILLRIVPNAPKDFLADAEFDLRTRSSLGEDYESSTILSKFYAKGNVPDDLELIEDVTSTVRLYEEFLGEVSREEKDGSGIWLFQANPKVFDLKGACKVLPELRFDVRQSHKQIHKGDRVYLWESGQAGGVVAVGEILSNPAQIPFAPGEEEFVRNPSKLSAEQLAVRIRLETVLDPILSREGIQAQQGLEKLQVLTFPRATNYRVSADQDKILRRLVELIRPLPIDGSLPTVVERFSADLKEAGLRFGTEHRALVRAFISALATKRLAILTGLSGSGKTQLALSLGRWFGEQRYCVIPVRPDWTGPEALLGYADALQEVHGGCRAWQLPDALRFILRASGDPSHPYLLLLDEMNLAHVERYFADVLSGMESNEPCIPNVRLSSDGLWREASAQGDKLIFPRNLFVVGTVNVDETTYMFSPKVLDRANTFEFRVDVEDLHPDLQRPGPCASGPEPLLRYFLQVALDDHFQDSVPSRDVDNLVGHLKALHRILAKGGFEFGHRVFYEALRFAAYFATAGEPNQLRALDRIAMQKLLPRLHGSYRRLHGLMAELGHYAYALDGGGTALGTAFDPDTHLAAEAKLPVSFEKIQRMTRSLRANQFVSFTE